MVAGVSARSILWTSRGIQTPRSPGAASPVPPRGRSTRTASAPAWTPHPPPRATPWTRRPSRRRPTVSRRPLPMNGSMRCRPLSWTLATQPLPGTAPPCTPPGTARMFVAWMAQMPCFRALTACARACRTGIRPRGRFAPYLAAVPLAIAATTHRAMPAARSPCSALWNAHLRLAHPLMHALARVRRGAGSSSPRRTPQ